MRETSAPAQIDGRARPHFHFNVKDGLELPDPQGMELENLFAERLEAARFSGELLKAHAADFWVDHEWRIEVTDAAVMILFAIHISAVELRSTSGSRRLSDQFFGLCRRSNKVQSWAVL